MEIKSNTETATTAGSAPWYSIANRTFVSVEHPFIVRNTPEAIRSLGGPASVGKLLSSQDGEQEAELFLHPSDRMFNSIPSGLATTENLLFQLTIPKRTGRKRKRGSHEPFEGIVDDESNKGSRSNDSTDSGAQKKPRKRVGELLESLHDNPNTCELKIVGQIEKTHRFRVMPDFVYSTTSSAFMQKFRRGFLPLDCSSAKQYCFNSSTGSRQNEDLIPPPTFTHFVMPFNYNYHQNPAVKHVLDPLGNIKSINDTRARKVRSQRIAFNAEEVPLGPPLALPPIETLDSRYRHVIDKILTCLQERPIWTRRALKNRAQVDETVIIDNYLFQYVGYEFQSGPWRDAIIKFGLDPRSDPQYRVYQSMLFAFDSHIKPFKKATGIPARGGDRALLDPKPEQDRGLGANSHIFDGINVGLDSKVWQVCDITEPLIKSILGTAELRETCHLRTDGWFHNGTWARAKVIAKSKIREAISGKRSLTDYDYDFIAQMPDTIDFGTRSYTREDKAHLSEEAMTLIANIRAMAGIPMKNDHMSSSAAVRPKAHDSHNESIHDPNIWGTATETKRADHRVTEAMSILETMEATDNDSSGANRDSSISDLDGSEEEDEDEEEEEEDEEDGDGGY